MHNVNQTQEQQLQSENDTKSVIDVCAPKNSFVTSASQNARRRNHFRTNCSDENNASDLLLIDLQVSSIQQKSCGMNSFIKLFKKLGVNSTNKEGQKLESDQTEQSVQKTNSSDLTFHDAVDGKQNVSEVPSAESALANESKFHDSLESLRISNLENSNISQTSKQDSKELSVSLDERSLQQRTLPSFDEVFRNVVSESSQIQDSHNETYISSILTFNNENKSENISANQVVLNEKSTLAEDTGIYVSSTKELGLKTEIRDNIKPSHSDISLDSLNQNITEATEIILPNDQIIANINDKNFALKSTNLPVFEIDEDLVQALKTDKELSEIEADSIENLAVNDSIVEKRSIFDELDSQDIEEFLRNEQQCMEEDYMELEISENQSRTTEFNITNTSAQFSNAEMDILSLISDNVEGRHKFEGHFHTSNIQLDNIIEVNESSFAEVDLNQVSIETKALHENINITNDFVNEMHQDLTSNRLDMPIAKIEPVENMPRIKDSKTEELVVLSENSSMQSDFKNKSITSVVAASEKQSDNNELERIVNKDFTTENIVVSPFIASPSKTPLQYVTSKSINSAEKNQEELTSQSQFEINITKEEITHTPKQSEVQIPIDSPCLDKSIITLENNIESLNSTSDHFNSDLSFLHGSLKELKVNTENKSEIDFNDEFISECFKSDLMSTKNIDSDKLVVNLNNSLEQVIHENTHTPSKVEHLSIQDVEIIENNKEDESSVQESTTIFDSVEKEKSSVSLTGENVVDKPITVVESIFSDIMDKISEEKQQNVDENILALNNTATSSILVESIKNDTMDETQKNAKEIKTNLNSATNFNSDIISNDMKHDNLLSVNSQGKIRTEDLISNQKDIKTVNSEVTLIDNVPHKLPAATDKKEFQQIEIKFAENFENMPDTTAKLITKTEENKDEIYKMLGAIPKRIEIQNHIEVINNLNTVTLSEPKIISDENASKELLATIEDKIIKESQEFKSEVANNIENSPNESTTTLSENTKNEILDTVPVKTEIQAAITLNENISKELLIASEETVNKKIEKFENKITNDLEKRFNISTTTVKSSENEIFNENTATVLDSEVTSNKNTVEELLVTTEDTALHNEKIQETVAIIANNITSTSNRLISTDKNDTILRETESHDAIIEAVINTNNTDLLDSKITLSEDVSKKLLLATEETINREIQKFESKFTNDVENRLYQSIISAKDNKKETSNVNTTVEELPVTVRDTVNKEDTQETESVIVHNTENSSNESTTIAENIKNEISGVGITMLDLKVTANKNSVEKSQVIESITSEENQSETDNNDTGNRYTNLGAIPKVIQLPNNEIKYTDSKVSIEKTSKELDRVTDDIVNVIHKEKLQIFEEVTKMDDLNDTIRLNFNMPAPNIPTEEMSSNLDTVEKNETTNGDSNSVVLFDSNTTSMKQQKTEITTADKLDSNTLNPATSNDSVLTDLGIYESPVLGTIYEEVSQTVGIGSDNDSNTITTFDLKASVENDKILVNKIQTIQTNEKQLTQLISLNDTIILDSTNSSFDNIVKEIASTGGKKYENNTIEMQKIEQGVTEKLVSENILKKSVSKVEINGSNEVEKLEKEATNDLSSTFILSPNDTSNENIIGEIKIEDSSVTNTIEIKKDDSILKAINLSPSNFNESFSEKPVFPADSKENIISEIQKQESSEVAVGNILNSTVILSSNEIMNENVTEETVTKQTIILNSDDKLGENIKKNLDLKVENILESFSKETMNEDENTVIRDSTIPVAPFSKSGISLEQNTFSNESKNGKETIQIESTIQDAGFMENAPKSIIKEQTIFVGKNLIESTPPIEKKPGDIFVSEVIQTPETSEKIQTSEVNIAYANNIELLNKQSLEFSQNLVDTTETQKVESSNSESEQIVEKSDLNDNETQNNTLKDEKQFPNAEPESNTGEAEENFVSGEKFSWGWGFFGRQSKSNDKNTSKGPRPSVQNLFDPLLSKKSESPKPVKSSNFTDCETSDSKPENKEEREFEKPLKPNETKSTSQLIKAEPSSTTNIQQIVDEVKSTPVRHKSQELPIVNKQRPSELSINVLVSDKNTKILKPSAQGKEVIEKLKKTSSKVEKLQLLNNLEDIICATYVRQYGKEDFEKILSEDRNSKKVKMTQLEKRFENLLEENKELVNEKIIIQKHLEKCWDALEDVKQKYDSRKESIFQYQDRETHGLKLIEDQFAESNTLDKKYEILKAQSSHQLEKYNEEYNKIKHSCDAEVLALKTQLRRLQLQNESLEQDLKQKTDERNQLNEMCDNLLMKKK